MKSNSNVSWEWYFEMTFFKKKAQIIPNIKKKIAKSQLFRYFEMSEKILLLCNHPALFSLNE
jgi:hypothetical protein